MNKITRSICMMAVVALAFSACKKQETNTDSMVFNHSMEQFVMVNDENEFEKVYLDNSNNIAYEAGDKLMLFDIRNDAANSEAVLYELKMNTADQLLLTPVSGSFTNTSNAGLGDYYAFYPGENVDVTKIHNENRVTFTLDAVQNYRPNTSDGTMIPHDALYIAAKAEQHELANAIFGCRNICGVLKLNLFSIANKKVRSIEVTDNAFNIVGNVELKVDEVDPDYMSSLFSRYSEDATYQSELADYLNTLGYNATGTKTVTLDCGSEGVALGKTKAAATPFYIVMRPLALLKGCTIKVNFTNGTSKTLNSSKNNVIKPNTIRNMSAVAVG